MTDQETGTSEDKPKSPLEGNTIVSAAGDAAAEFFKATFPALEERIKTIVATNTTDPVAKAAIDKMTADLLKQIQATLSTLFTNVGKAPPEGK